MVLPWASGLNKAWGLPVSAPPIPSLFSAYTPYLDEMNSSWLLGENAPRFILMNRPISIDGRFPFWDSPKFQVSIYCNYDGALWDSDYLLLQRVPRKCDNGKVPNSTETRSGDFIIAARPGEIVIGNLRINESIPSILLQRVFKKPTSDTLSIDGNSYRIVSATTTNLILSVGEGVQFPGVWNIGNSHRYSLPSGWTLSTERIRVEQGFGGDSK